MADVWSGLVLKGLGGRKGMATENFDATNKVRYNKPDQETRIN